ncbi:unnamed protein product [Blepharisma stoltei]|uniref:PPM-type phosphatase domain-containing protein n=1 Tax=Blepharisma stoltei TaxID=1481888 RepID=A0AAU9KQW6_9CILI|nr:unnamed protein product [Blepharisma stoltei]
MGNCCLNSAPEFLQELVYTSFANLKVYDRDSDGTIKGRSNVQFELSSPVLQSSLNCKLNNHAIRITGCAIPGLDPRKNRAKDCQDTYAIVEKGNVIMTSLFDGHGKEGKKISHFCRDFMSNYLENNYEDIESDPIGNIERMTVLCDEALKKSDIDSILSGTTAVVVLFTSTGIHVGSVGDSRAVLSTIPKTNTPYQVPAASYYNRFKRPVLPLRILKAIPLTIDQKPNHFDELKRIIASGGFVERVKDEIGNEIGPFRVWKKRGIMPGLAVSRSIGDRMAKEVGVISTPVNHTFPLYFNRDQFIVIASDGIWDTMENLEVVNFVERFRHSSKFSSGASDFPVNTNNSTIARLLCEEARYRWFGIIEDEDVVIDDISCVIIEMNCLEPSTTIEPESSTEERNIKGFQSITTIDESKKEDEKARESAEPGKVKVVRRDFVRGSTAAVEENE